MKIALYEENDIIGKVVKFFSRGIYVHSSIILNDGSVIDARPWKGVQKHKSLDDTIKGKNVVVDVFEVETNEEEDRIITNFLYKQLGKKYDWWSIFGFVLHTTHEGRKSYNKWFCSELTFSPFDLIGKPLLVRCQAWMVSPTIISYSNILRFVKSVIKK